MAESTHRVRLRERLVRDLSQLGYTVAEMADALDVSEATIKRIRAGIRAKEAQVGRMRDARSRLAEAIGE